MVKVFVSYRRSDAAAIAGRIYDRLSAYYSAASVFLDIDDIPPGVDFRTHIAKILETCNVVLAVVGPRWRGQRQGRTERIHQADDPVRAELEVAFRENLSVIPLLVDRADMPNVRDVPESLRDFVFLNAVRIDNGREFNVQVGRLIGFIDSFAQRVKPKSRSRRTAMEGAPVTSNAESRADLDGRPTIAVLPFQNFTGDLDQTHFSDGIADSIINELASWRLFPVIARGSTIGFKGHPTDITQVGERLGARYIVEGSFNRIGERIRISARLVDAMTGVQVASERFDRQRDELPEVQDQVTEMIVGSLAPEVLRAERQRAALQKPRKNLTSYECFLRGLEAHYHYTKIDNAKAQLQFRKAIEADPQNAQAHALLAHAMLHAVQLGWREDREHNYTVADQFASRAVALDPRAPFAHFSLGSTSMFLGRIDQSLREMSEAVRINPSHAAAHVIMAHLLCYVGRPGDALKSVNRGLRLSPYDPRLGLWLPAACQANYFLKDYEEAAAVGQQALSLIPDNPLARRFAAASFGQLGRVADAEPIVSALRRSSAPSIEAIRASVTRLYRHEEMIEHMLEGLRKAGLN